MNILENDSPVLSSIRRSNSDEDISKVSAKSDRDSFTSDDITKSSGLTNSGDNTITKNGSNISIDSDASASGKEESTNRSNKNKITPLPRSTSAREIKTYYDKYKMMKEKLQKRIEAKKRVSGDKEKYSEREEERDKKKKDRNEDKKHKDRDEDKKYKDKIDTRKYKERKHKDKEERDEERDDEKRDDEKPMGRIDERFRQKDEKKQGEKRERRDANKEKDLEKEKKKKRTKRGRNIKTRGRTMLHVLLAGVN